MPYMPAGGGANPPGPDGGAEDYCLQMDRQIIMGFVSQHAPTTKHQASARTSKSRAGGSISRKATERSTRFCALGQ